MWSWIWNKPSGADEHAITVHLDYASPRVCHLLTHQEHVVGPSEPLSLHSRLCQYTLLLWVVVAMDMSCSEDGISLSLSLFLQSLWLLHSSALSLVLWALRGGVTLWSRFQLFFTLSILCSRGSLHFLPFPTGRGISFTAGAFFCGFLGGGLILHQFR